MKKAFIIALFAITAMSGNISAQQSRPNRLQNCRLTSTATVMSITCKAMHIPTLPSATPRAASWTSSPSMPLLTCTSSTSPC